jgi:hypothetical protein
MNLTIPCAKIAMHEIYLKKRREEEEAIYDKVIYELIMIYQQNEERKTHERKPYKIPNDNSHWLKSDKKFLKWTLRFLKVKINKNEKWLLREIKKRVKAKIKLKLLWSLWNKTRQEIPIPSTTNIHIPTDEDDKVDLRVKWKFKIRRRVTHTKPNIELSENDRRSKRYCVRKTFKMAQDKLPDKVSSWCKWIKDKFRKVLNYLNPKTKRKRKRLWNEVEIVYTPFGISKFKEFLKWKFKKPKEKIGISITGSEFDVDFYKNIIPIFS